MNEPIVAVGIIIWNGEESISKTLDALLDQTYQNIKIYILDNQSTDKTVNILKHYATKDCRIHYCVDEKKRDIAGAQRFIFDKFLANHEYCMFSCDDDLYAADFIEKIIFRLLSDINLSLVYSSYKLVDFLNNTKDAKNYPLYTKNVAPVCNARNFLIFRNCIPLFFGIYKVSSLSKSMPYFKMVDAYGFNHENLMLIHFLLWNKVDCIKDFYFFYREKERIKLYKKRGYKFSTNGIKKYYYSLIHNYHLTLEIYSICSESKVSILQRLSLYILLPLTYIHRTFYAFMIYPVISKLLSITR